MLCQRWQRNYWLKEHPNILENHCNCNSKFCTILSWKLKRGLEIMNTFIVSLKTMQSTASVWMRKDDNASLSIIWLHRMHTLKCHHPNQTKIPYYCVGIANKVVPPRPSELHCMCGTVWLVLVCQSCLRPVYSRVGSSDIIKCLCWAHEPDCRQDRCNDRCRQHARMRNDLANAHFEATTVKNLPIVMWNSLLLWAASLLHHPSTLPPRDGYN